MLRKAIVALAILLAGCARGPGNELTFATWGSIDEIETLKPLLASFQAANPDVPVRLIHIPDEYPHKLRLMAASGTMPDVVFLENQTLAGFARRGVLRDLGPFLAKDPSLHTQDFYPPVLTALTYKGTLYAVPRDLSNLVVFYNRALFDRAGVPYPKAGWTLDQMRETAHRLTVSGSQWGVGFAPYPLYWLPFLWSEGTDVIDASETRCTLETPATMAALRTYWGLRWTDHVAPTEAEVGNARMSQLFADGKLGMIVGGRWIVPGFRKRIHFPWDVAPFPAGKAGSIVDADASGWGISSQCHTPEKAWRLIRFLASKPAITAFTRSGLIVPARPDVANSPAFLQGAPASGKVFLDAIRQARPTRTPPCYDELEYELIDGLSPAWNNQESLDAAIKPVAARIQALLNEDQQP